MLQKGFTLIELMIVVAIIGILSMFALPAYQDYTKRTYVAEGMALASAAKLAVSEYYSSENTWPTTNSQAGLPAADQITGQAVNGIGIMGGGTNNVSEIVIYYGTKVLGGTGATAPTAATTAATRADGTLTLAPTNAAPAGSIQWECVGLNSDNNKDTTATGKIQGKWVPASCRSQIS